MKPILNFLLIALLFAFVQNATAQAPAGINFQGAARSQYLGYLTNKLITLRFNIRDKTLSGPVVYNEVRNTTTDSFGVFNVEIGAVGAVSQSGDIRKVKWSDTTAKFLQVEMDTHEGAPGFLDMGTTQLMSVPFSFYSDVSDSSRKTDSAKFSLKADSAKFSKKADSAKFSQKADSTRFSSSSGKYFFSATMPYGFKQTISSSSNTVKYPSVLYNEGLVYDSATSVFTTPEDGIYEFDMSVNGEFYESADTFEWALTKNDTLCKILGTAEGYYDSDNDRYELEENSLTAQVRLKLKKGDKIAIKLFGEKVIHLYAFKYWEDDGDYGNEDPPSVAFSEFSGYKIR
ncbi:MAG TPA: hypothetical protein VFW07_05340 [Parafilimonas sp.]|nr:hypothetical protein [Parafilimonas sp.]